MPHHEHWYEIVGGDQLRQGDILRDFAVPFFPDRLAECVDELVAAGPGSEIKIPVDFERGDWIVVDASCDVYHDGARPAAIKQVLVARVLPADARYLKASTDKELDERRETLRQGLAASKFLLAAYPDIEPAFPLSFVEYRQRFSLPHTYIVASASRLGQRLRLRSPIRERFGNWAGAALSHVGPEEDAVIPPFVPRLHQRQLLRAGEALTRTGE